MIAKLFNSFKKSPLLALLNSNRLEISAKNGWRARGAGEPTTSFPNWRRVQDSNLQGIAPNGFRDHRNSHSANPPNWWTRWDLNPQPPDCQPGALPLSYRPISSLCSRQELNLHQKLRSLLFYPLNYGSENTGIYQ